jgi:hypothetical protein
VESSSPSAATSVESANLSMAYSDTVAHASAVREGSWMASEPPGERVAVQIPEAQWQKLAAAICAITGGEVV